MRLTLIAISVGLLISGCALRPRYADFVSAKTEGKEVTFVITDAATNLPVPNAKVEVSELRNRIQATTGADGTFTVPVEKKYLDENPVFVVKLPKGVVEYRLALAPPPPAPAPEAPAAPEVPAAPEAPAEPPPAEAAADAGVPASNP